jgi:hypothetical protein
MRVRIVIPVLFWVLVSLPRAGTQAATGEFALEVRNASGAWEMVALLQGPTRPSSPEQPRPR